LSRPQNEREEEKSTCDSSVEGDADGDGGDGDQSSGDEEGDSRPAHKTIELSHADKNMKALQSKPEIDDPDRPKYNN